MALQSTLYAKENRRRRKPTGESVDIPFLIILLLLLAVGLLMLYSASSAQSEFDTGYTDSTRYLQKQAVCALIGLAAMYFIVRYTHTHKHTHMWSKFLTTIKLKRELTVKL